MAHSGVDSPPHARHRSQPARCPPRYCANASSPRPRKPCPTASAHRAPATAHHRRRIVHLNVTANPTAAWTAQQVVEAFPEDTAPRYLLRDRDRIYGPAFRRRVDGLGISEVLTAARSPRQNPYAERVIGSIPRGAP